MKKLPIKLQRKRTPKIAAASQRGIALILVISVLFALTMLGLASTDSSNLQSLMVRNNQFRLEAFNISYNEIESQMEFYETSTGKKPLFYVIDTGSLSADNLVTETDTSNPDTSSTETAGTAEQSSADAADAGTTVTGADEFYVRTNNGLFDKTITLSKTGGCAIFANTVGGFKKCSLMQLDSNAEYQKTNIGSDQAQQFSFLSY